MKDTKAGFFYKLGLTFAALGLPIGLLCGAAGFETIADWAIAVGLLCGFGMVILSGLFIMWTEL